jgi:ABC-type branched-subunit amino acid transport system substrate-binding protein
VVAAAVLTVLSWPAASAAGLLTPSQARGRSIYATCKSPGGAVDATVAGGLVLPAASYPCATCHGPDGRGGVEGGVMATNVRWSFLTAPHGVATPLGGLRPPYTRETFVRAVRDGIDSAGNPLDPLMPRYAFSDADLADLIDYLETLEAEEAPGVTAETLRVGSVVPLSGPQGQEGRALADLLARYFAQVNDAGGINGRRIEHVAKDAGASVESALAASRSLLDDPRGIFCLLANAGTGAAPEVLSLLAERDVPTLGPLTFEAETSERGSVFYLLPSLEDQARAAGAYVTRRAAAGAAVAVIPGRGPDARIMARVFTDTIRQSGLTVLDEGRDPSLPAEEVTGRLRGSGAALVALFMPAAQAQPLVDAAAARDWRPTFLASTVLLGGPLRASGSLVLVSPPIVPQPSHPRVEAYLRLGGAGDGMPSAGRPRLPPSALALAAFGAADLLTASLEAVGRDLRRDKLLAHLSGIHSFETGVLPALTFGPNRRLGVRGALLSSSEAGVAAPPEWIEVGGGS